MQTKSGRPTKVLHTFFRLDDGSFLAFFEAPDMPFEFKPQHDFDLHIALEVTQDALHAMFEKGKAAGIETRGISDHRFIDSIYFRDPNGYVIELTAKRPGHDEAMDPAHATGARDIVREWTAEKTRRGLMLASMWRPLGRAALCRERRPGGRNLPLPTTTA